MRHGARGGVRHLREDLWQQSRLCQVRHVLLLLGLLQLLLERLEREGAERQDVQAPAADASGACVGASLWAGGHGARLVDCPRAAPAALLTRVTLWCAAGGMRTISAGRRDRLSFPFAL